jgi:glycosyltransferase involved in cell wall biosynthesis
MDIAIVHDHLMQRGGAERVLISMAKAFPSAAVYTSIYDSQKTYPEIGDLDVRTLFVDKLPLLHRNFRLALPLLPIAFSRLAPAADITLCSSAGWSHGTNVTGKKIVYWYSPAKWLYQTDQYFAGRKSAPRLALTLLRSYLQRWDQRAARRGGRHLTLSTAVQARLRDVYGIEAEVVPAPHTIDVGGGSDPVAGVDAGFWLCIARLVPQKNVDVVIEAFRSLPGESLLIVGRGPEEARLRAAAPRNVRFLGAVTDPQIRWLYQQCRAIVSASYEDYGLTPLEAAAFGKPSAALRWGGFLDTIIEDDTGVLFAEATPSDLADAVVRLKDLSVAPDRLQAHAELFSEERFVARLQSVVREEQQ